MQYTIELHLTYFLCYLDLTANMGLFPVGRTKGPVQIFCSCPENERAGHTVEEGYYQHNEASQMLCQAGI